MQLFQKCIIAAAVWAVVGPVVAPAQSDDFKAARSLDIFHSTLRELSLFYVDSVKVDRLVEIGVEAMLESLDPYTVYLPEEASDDFDIVTTGQYGGVGALIRKSAGGVEISEQYEGFPADRAGLVAGDLLIEIDGQSALDMPVDKASTTLRGIAGTEVALKVVKLRGGDTVALSVTRERVHISDVVYAGLVADSIGYIRVASFTKDGSRDFKNAFLSLRKTGRLRQLIIDVRSNGGGLLDEAVNMVGLFVPYGTEVVTARGRIKLFEATYKTKETPLDTQIPIAVLVNSASASAAEILAGALQDMDRAVVIGTRTFGKGLVQSVRQLGYNTQLKVTSAKYYIPSGRCIQIIDYSHRNEDGSAGNIPDSLRKAFRTKNGRTVYDGGGITPDVLAEPATYTRTTYELVARDIPWKYSTRYFASHPAIAAPDDFHLTDDDYEQFIDYAVGQQFDGRTATELHLEKLVETLKSEQLYDDTKDELAALQAKVNTDKRDKLRRFRPELQPLLEEEIVSRYYYTAGRIRAMLRRDTQMNATIELLQHKDTYGALLNAPAVKGGE
ncbi:MAG: S41 family peptidase [Prevotellaceae bacterium]|jgi:carboxyl-terminal processing protease|nr:S41 family peptidase [Prevotellaceae bacterium]